MTSINAIKFDEYSGACVCDEARCWNDEAMKIYTAEKIKPCIPDEITARYGTVAAYGNTGTSTLGDEFKWTIKRSLLDELEKRTEKEGRPPSKFMSIQEIAGLIFKILTQTKHTHVNDQLKGRYGFTTSDFINGSYEKDGKTIEIKQKEIIEEVEKFITWKDSFDPVTPVFLNAGIMAGFEESNGFRLFHYSLIEGFWEAVQAAFIVDGSGRDAAGLSLSDYFNHKTIPERGRIDPAEGLVAILEAVNAASRFNLGVEGYYNIILIDGRKREQSKRLVEINDHRAKMAADIVHAMSFELVSRDAAHALVKNLILDGKPLPETAAAFEKSARNRKELSRFLRGYKVAWTKKI